MQFQKKNSIESSYKLLRCFLVFRAFCKNIWFNENKVKKILYFIYFWSTYVSSHSTMHSTKASSLSNLNLWKMEHFKLRAHNSPKTPLKDSRRMILFENLNECAICILILTPLHQLHSFCFLANWWARRCNRECYM